MFFIRYFALLCSLVDGDLEISRFYKVVLLEILNNTLQSLLVHLVGLLFLQVVLDLFP